MLHQLWISEPSKLSFKGTVSKEDLGKLYTLSCACGTCIERYVNFIVKLDPMRNTIILGYGRLCAKFKCIHLEVDTNR